MKWILTPDSGVDEEGRKLALEILFLFTLQEGMYVCTVCMTCIYVCIDVGMYVHVCIYVRVCIYMYVCMYLCVCVCVCKCIYVCIYIYMYRYTYIYM